jgi:flagellar hook-associated protein 3 FlgL
MNIEVVKNNIETKLTDENLTDDETEILNTQLEAAEKAYTLAKDKCQRAFEGGITAFQGYLDDANLCITDTGTRSKKLELIENRMQNQKTTFETLKSENEDIDITEVAIQLSSAELTYEAALMATGKVMQSTLLNYI